ncbi:unnamed protein product [Caenorhabditis sp. 36 PRJEB53466]|nr:unnamed protein product [Caenorhabditis sp. 36 PRJEB53466]
MSQSFPLFICVHLLIVSSVYSNLNTRKEFVSRSDCGPNGWLKALYNNSDSTESECYETPKCPIINGSEVCPERNITRDFQKDPLSNYDPANFEKCDTDGLHSLPPHVILCPGNPVPVGHEQKCLGSVPGSDTSGTCFHPSGTCFKGFCCPALNMTKPYVTRARCNPKCPLPSNWTLAFCDSETRLVVFAGRELMYSSKIHRSYSKWKPENCEGDVRCKKGEVCVMNATAPECWPNPLRPPKFPTRTHRVMCSKCGCSSESAL